jgi:DeoR family suf operon transcriptional repressor
MPPHLVVHAQRLYLHNTRCQLLYANIYLHIYPILIYLLEIMLNSRQKILSYLDEQLCATAEELSRVFHVTPSNIRHHLSILMDQGCVEVIAQKIAPNKGRPTQVYASVEKNARGSLEPLADGLLAELLQSCPPGEADHPFKRIASTIVSRYHFETNNPTRRLYNTMKVLNQMGYHAHWEAHVVSPRIMLDKCPYRSLVDRHPEVCQLDKYIIERCLATPVEQIEKKSVNRKSLTQCVFMVSGLV